MGQYCSVFAKIIAVLAVVATDTNLDFTPCYIIIIDTKDVLEQFDNSESCVAVLIPSWLWNTCDIQLAVAP